MLMPDREGEEINVSKILPGAQFELAREGGSINLMESARAMEKKGEKPTGNAGPPLTHYNSPQRAKEIRSVLRNRNERRLLA